MKGVLRVATAGIALAVLAACASPTLRSDQLGMIRDTRIGAVLTDAAGMTLYTYDKDEAGKSHCTGVCAVAWPPVTAPEGATARDGFTIIARPGGEHQWAYRGQPLYTYRWDREPGDVGGDGVDAVWHAARS